MSTRVASSKDALLVHGVYLQSPGYFDIISMPVPSEEEVCRELEAAGQDPKRHVELVLSSNVEAHEGVAYDRVSGQTVVGYLDYKLDYPESGDATVNLLLIAEPLRSRGLGRRCVEALERSLSRQAQRILASIYGRNPGARRFWQARGYRYAIDARPVLEWYAKNLT